MDGHHLRLAVPPALAGGGRKALLDHAGYLGDQTRVTRPPEPPACRYCSLRPGSARFGTRRYCPVRCGTIVAMSTEALRTVKDRLSEFVDRVQQEHDRVVITRNGTPAAVLISPDDLESLEETLDLLSDRKAVKELRDAERAVAAGDVVRGVDTVRNLRGG